MDGTTYSVRIYKTEVYRGSEVTTYWVRWKVDGQLLREPFRNAAQADSFRSSLLTAARNGEAFSIETGQPVSWKRAQPYELVQVRHRVRRHEMALRITQSPARHRRSS